jgi:hypothetical protein
MKPPLNGKTKVVTGAAAIAALCSVLSYAGGAYAGWTKKVEASVVMQRMVNAHDEALKDIVPKVDACHELNERQQWDLDQNRRDIAALADTVKETNKLVQLYLQSRMKAGEIPR